MDNNGTEMFNVPHAKKGDPVDTDYCINDYRINELPDVNPLQ